MRSGRPVRVLVVDDSALARNALSAMLSRDSSFEVIGEAADGYAAIELTRILRPDLITMDVRMPHLDGLSAIEAIMSQCPTPILVVTGATEYAGRRTEFEALSRGAIQLVRKPSLADGSDDEVTGLLDAARMSARVPVVRHIRGSRTHATPPASKVFTGERPPRVVLVGASTGGPGAIRGLLKALGKDFDLPIVAVQHLFPGFTDGFVTWLDEVSPMPVREGLPGTVLKSGHAYVVARGCSVGVNESLELVRARSAPGPYQPSIDALFTSANVLAPDVAAVLLTGMGDDGVEGLKQLCDAGCWTAAQDESSSIVFGMPQQAHAADAVAYVGNPSSIARQLKGQIAIGRLEESTV